MDHMSSYNPYDIRFVDECGLTLIPEFVTMAPPNLVAELFTLLNTMLDPITLCFQCWGLTTKYLHMFQKEHQIPLHT